MRKSRARRIRAIPTVWSAANAPFVIEAFGGGPRVLSDGARQVEVHPLPTSHAEDLVVVYLPKERLLIEADHISPRDGQVRPGPRVKEFVQGARQAQARRRDDRRHPRRPGESRGHPGSSQEVVGAFHPGRLVSNFFMSLPLSQGIQMTWMRYLEKKFGGAFPTTMS